MADITVNQALKWLTRITLLLALVASNGPISFTGFHYASLVRIEAFQARTFRRRSVASFKKACDSLLRSLVQASNAAQHFVACMLLYEIVIRLRIQNNSERFVTANLVSSLFHPCYYTNPNSDEPFAHRMVQRIIHPQANRLATS